MAGSPAELPTRSLRGSKHVIRRSIAGPLDGEDPLTPPTASSTFPVTQSMNSVINNQASQRQHLNPDNPPPPPPKTSFHSPNPSQQFHPKATIDLSYLLRPQLYLPLPVPSLPSFHIPPSSPAVHAPPSLPSILQTKDFRSASLICVDILTSSTKPLSSPQDNALILSTFHTRLACLIVLGYVDIAAQESRSLHDILQRVTRMQQVNQPAPSRRNGIINTEIPWTLRILIYKLNAWSQGDARREIMGFYTLAGECRAIIRTIDDNQPLVLNDEAMDVANKERKLWEKRLFDVGMCVVKCLVMAGELDAARRELHSLVEAQRQVTGQHDELEVEKRLLDIKIGNVHSALHKKRQSDGHDDGHSERILSALTQVAEGKYEDASRSFQTLHEKDRQNVLIANNYAVCLLYTGCITDAIKVLESVTSLGNTSTLLFNLATMYELSTERSIDLKKRLTEKVAQAHNEGKGWERQALEFKL